MPKLAPASVIIIQWIFKGKMLVLRGEKEKRDLQDEQLSEMQRSQLLFVEMFYSYLCLFHVS